MVSHAERVWPMRSDALERRYAVVNHVGEERQQVEYLRALEEIAEAGHWNAMLLERASYEFGVSVSVAQHRMIAV
jgi:hypothetical protein